MGCRRPARQTALTGFRRSGEENQAPRPVRAIHDIVHLLTGATGGILRERPSQNYLTTMASVRVVVLYTSPEIILRSAFASLYCCHGDSPGIQNTESVIGTHVTLQRRHQDNEVGWIDWGRLHANPHMLRLFTPMIGFRKAHPSLARSRFWREDARWHRVERNLASLYSIQCPAGQSSRSCDTGWAQPGYRYDRIYY